MSMDDNLFDDETLFEGIDLDTPVTSNVIELKIKETNGELTVLDQDVELNEEETKVVEGDAIKEASDLNSIDALIDSYKEPTKAEIEKAKRLDAQVKAKAIADALPKTETPVPKAPVIEEKYLGPRTVRVYGSELFIESDPNVTLEDIRKRLVDEYKFVEYEKDRTEMFLDKASGIVVPRAKFEKRG